MTLFRTVEPSLEPVTVADVKAHLRLQHDSEDGLLGELICVARATVEQQTGCALIDQSWRLCLDRWPSSGRVLIGRHPVKQILSVTVFGRDGGGTVLAPESYGLDYRGRPARLHVESALQPARLLNGIEIDFTCGFGEAGTDVPDTLRRAVIILAAHFFEFRTTIQAKDQPVSYPPGYDALVAPYRARRL